MLFNWICGFVCTCIEYCKIIDLIVTTENCSKNYWKIKIGHFSQSQNMISFTNKGKFDWPVLWKLLLSFCFTNKHALLSYETTP